MISLYEGSRDTLGQSLLETYLHYGIADWLERPGGASGFIDTLTPEAFSDLIVAVHAAVTNRSREDTIFTSQQNAVCSHDDNYLFVAPSGEDKQPLVEKVLAYAQQTKEESAKVAILAFGIAAVHPFSDGNGRTARSLWYLLNSGQNVTLEGCNKVVGELGEAEFPMNLPLIYPDLNYLIACKTKSHMVGYSGPFEPRIWPKYSSAEGASRFKQRLNLAYAKGAQGSPSHEDDVYAALGSEKFLAAEMLFRLFSSNHRLFNSVPLNFDEETRRTFFPIDKLMEAPSPDDIENIRDEYHAVARERVELLLKLISNSFPVEIKFTVVDSTGNRLCLPLHELAAKMISKKVVLKSTRAD